MKNKTKLKQPETIESIDDPRVAETAREMADKMIEAFHVINIAAYRKQVLVNNIDQLNSDVNAMQPVDFVMQNVTELIAAEKELRAPARVIQELQVLLEIMKQAKQYVKTD